MKAQKTGKIYQSEYLHIWEFVMLIMIRYSPKHPRIQTDTPKLCVEVHFYQSFVFLQCSFKILSIKKTLYIQQQGRETFFPKTAG